MRALASTDPASLSLTAVAAALRSGELRAESLAAAYLERIAHAERRVRAWAWIDRERLLEQARRIDALRDSGAAMGPLAGVPIGVKDIIDTAGIPTRLGSPLFEDHVPIESATCVRRIEAAGGIVQGKTVTTEFANRKPGPTTNPFDARFSPGGSSSGSAAAVAAAFTAAALGSQTLGSTIRPAVYCGVVGFKPSFGLISRHGVHPLSPTLDHVGLITRTIEDAALLASCLIGFDPRDPDSLPEADSHRVAPTVGDLIQPPRLAAVRTAHWARAEKAQQQLFEANCAALREAGADVEFIELPAAFERGNDVGALIQAVEAASHFRDLRARGGAQMSPEFRALCDRGAQIASADYEAALEARTAMRRAIEPVLRTYDAIATLAGTAEAPKSLSSTGEPTFCSVWSVCGLPAIAFPTGLGPQQLPMGLQIVGPYLADAQLIQVAHWCRRRLPQPAPPLV